MAACQSNAEKKQEVAERRNKCKSSIEPRLRRACSCCRELFQASPSCDSITGKPPRWRFWQRRNRIEPTLAPPPTVAPPPTPVPPPTPQGGSQASSGVTIELSPAAEKIRERDQVILWWTTLLNSIVERVHDAESWWEYPVEFDKEIMEDVTAHPDPGSFFRKTLDTVTELRLLLLLLLGSLKWFDCLQRFFLTFLRYNVQALLPGSL
ncbi:uncharacterized protein LOC128343703 [Hemicordylus capensis]|uniref:uncharacterized protein LOC128343703 n=1 Tax=Hemicordylus capensis TaxID=884348 RepID=UPI002302D028|nr:uncharacterized protein LOC128343703 [Hemicordylus capensis]